MANSRPNTTFREKLISLSAEPAGFSASELTGYSPEQVRGTAESLVKSGKISKRKVGAHRVRYFANEKLAKQYTPARNSARSPRSMGVKRASARWDPDAPARITPETKIYIAPPQPRNVYWTNTYPKF